MLVVTDGGSERLMIRRRSLGRKGVEFTLNGWGEVNCNVKCYCPDEYIILLVNMLKTSFNHFKSYVLGMSWVKIK